MATPEETQTRPAGGRVALTLVQMAVIVPTVAYLAVEVSSQTDPFEWGNFIFWVAVVATWSCCQCRHGEDCESHSSSP
jgi:hypothetical protein